MIRLIFIYLLFTSISFTFFAQSEFSGTVSDENGFVPFAKIKIKEINSNALSDINGTFKFTNLPEGNYLIEIYSAGYETLLANCTIPSTNNNFTLLLANQLIEEIVVSGTLKEVSKKESTVNVEVYSSEFFKKNPSPSIFESLQNVNGVRPQLNCNICNTGDIHINGLEGPYTMILIDGMPIVSSLSSVYGLSGIPNSMVQRMEIVKGPASSLYGSEAIGGIINIITKQANLAPLFSLDVHTTSWLETNVDISMKAKLGKKVDLLTGVNYFNYDLKKDNNDDNFTDVTLQDRISIFQKWNFRRKDYRLFSIAGRYVYEDRWGGEMNWTPDFRGGDSLYGESIYTNRWEIISKYQLPLKEKIMLSTSFNYHNQNSFYGQTSFMASQIIGFGQLHWDKKIGKNDLIIGTAVRYTNYDDNTIATQSNDSLSPKSLPSITWLPGVFIQDEISVSQKHKILLGVRYDYNSLHGSIFTPRIGYKWSINSNNIFRFNAGTGYRVVNVFTEDHAALTGARDVIVANNIKPEQSYNANVNFNKTIITSKNKYFVLDLTGFYTYFNNRIIPDYDSDPNKIFYGNLNSYAVSQGVSFKFGADFIRNLNVKIGGTLMDIYIRKNGKKEHQILTEKFSGNWSVSYSFPKTNLEIDYTGNIYSPMRLPLLNENDPRPEESPWWSIQNIQLTFKGLKKIEIYGGVKNFLNWTPNKNAAFLIARSQDPFDKNVEFDANGNAQSTATNPYGLTFDPSYVYAPNQGIRGFLGVRLTIQ